MKHLIDNTIVRRSLKGLAITILVIILLPVLLYVPPVQNLIKNIAEKQVSKATGMDISIDRILLKFPLDLSVDGLKVLDTHRDTMVVAQNLTLTVQPLPLLDLDVKVGTAQLIEGHYRLLSSDSSMLLKAHVQLCKLKGSDINLDKNTISLDDGLLSGGDVSLVYDQSKVKPTPPDTTKSKGWHIVAHHVALEKLHYTMQMLPLIDKIDTYIGLANLDDGLVDMDNHKIHARCLAVDSVSAKYFTPTAEYIASHPVKPDTATVATTTTDTAKWTITSDSIRLTRINGIYAVSGATPGRGLDMNYIAGSDMNLSIDNFYNHGTSIVVPITHFTAAERCGLRIIEAYGTFSMDSLGMKADSFNLKTILSDIYLDGYLSNGFFDFLPDSRLRLKLNANLGLAEAGKLYPIYRPLLRKIPQANPLAIRLDIDGSPKRLNIEKATFNLPHYASAELRGQLLHPFNMKKMTGDIALRGVMNNLNFVKSGFLDASLRKQVNFPPLSVSGAAKFTGSAVAGNMKMALPGGKVAMAAKFNSLAKAYNVKFDFNQFPVHSILPLSTIGNVTAQGSVKGHGYDPLKKSTAIDAVMNIVGIRYNNQDYTNVSGTVKLVSNHFDVNMASANTNCDFTLKGNGVISNNHYIFDLTSDIRDLNLKALRFSPTTSNGQGHIVASGDFDLKRQIYMGSVDLTDFNWSLPDNYFYAPALSATFLSNDTVTMAKIDNNDFKLDFNSECGAKSFLKKLERSQKIALAEFKARSLNVDTLQKALPRFTCNVSIGQDNLVQQFIANTDLKFGSFNMNIINDSTIYMNGQALALQYGENAVDTINVFANEKNKDIAYNLHVGNRKGTLDDFAFLTMNGDISANNITAMLEQQNIKHVTGFRIGLNATLNDSAINVRLFPKNPLIGYREWEVNDSNFINYNYHNNHIGADLELRSDSSLVSLRTNHAADSKDEDIFVKMKGVQLAEWLNISPFAPPVKGVLDADMKLGYDGKSVWGDGLVNVQNLFYDEKKVGDVGMDAHLALNPATGATTLNANMKVNGHKAMFAIGVLNDSTQKNPFNVALQLDSFPLNTANPFIPDGMGEMKGYLDGALSMTGSPSSPILNGLVQCKSAALYMPVFGSKLDFSTTEVPIDSSVIHFNKFGILGSNKKAVELNGVVDVRQLDNPYVNLTMVGNDVQVVDSKQKRKSEVFGHGNIDLDAVARGHLNDLNVNARLTVLSGSNVTYVMQDEVSALTSGTTDNMVRFVSHADSLKALQADSLAVAEVESAMNVNAVLTVQPGVIVNVFISKDGADKMRINGSGILNYTQNTLGDTHFTGRYTIDEGFVRYSPPLISQVLFDFNSGSYISWTGDLFNPNLHIDAVETVKANVTEQGQNSHLVDFLVSVSVSNTLNNMGLNFDLSTNEDMTIQNELQSMSPGQRSNQAMNLLLYNTYTGANTSASSNLAGNPLYSFLQSQINTWAANTIKGVDLSFGINSYDKSSNGESANAMSYSYQLSKSLFNDRLKVVVGGNYNTSADNEENFTQNLLNDVSFEYLLNSSGNMYVRLFRHTGFESILEGEVTETGAGFVVKRKTSTLKHLFRLRHKGNRKKSSDSSSAAGVMPTKGGDEDKTKTVKQ
ncbi:MAG: translocation/assembly module TamB [Muribaculaceae bacterium]|nr:translocation/assembly module TamB [Muribaculaceae bacterium]